MQFADLPGNELVRDGLADLAAGRTTAASLLVLIGAERLGRIGLSIPRSPITDPEHRLYELLAMEDSDSAHSRYNALIRQLVSFERAAEWATHSA